MVLVLGRREALEWPPLEVRLWVGLCGDSAWGAVQNDAVCVCVEAWYDADSSEQVL